ncbi:MAG: helix-turn-helix domain-containing protein [Kofleriaceae bacterium]
MVKGKGPEDPRNLIIRENLQRFREEASMSQADAADASGVPLDNLRRYENGVTASVPHTVIATLAKVYGHAMEDFENPNPPPAKLEERPVFFLRTRPGAEIDQKTFRELQEIIDKANREARKKRK